MLQNSINTSSRKYKREPPNTIRQQAGCGRVNGPFGNNKSEIGKITIPITAEIP